MGLNVVINTINAKFVLIGWLDFVLKEEHVQTYIVFCFLQSLLFFTSTKNQIGSSSTRFRSYNAWKSVKKKGILKNIQTELFAIIQCSIWTFNLSSMWSTRSQSNAMSFCCKSNFEKDNNKNISTTKRFNCRLIWQMVFQFQCLLKHLVMERGNNFCAPKNSFLFSRRWSSQQCEML